MRRAVGVAWLCAAGLSLWGAVAWGDDLQRLAQELAQLRAQSEELAEQLRAVREDERLQLRGLSSLESDATVELQREQDRLAKLKERKEAWLLRQATQSKEQEALKPAVLEAVGLLRPVVEAGLPYRLEERLGDLDKLKGEVERGEVTAEAGLVRLWERVEDERRLGRESGLHAQVITLGGREVLADVARLGMVMMYAQTKDGRQAVLVSVDGQWRWEEAKDPAARRQISTLVEGLRKQLRVGLYELPWALPPQVQR